MLGYRADILWILGFSRELPDQRRGKPFHSGRRLFPVTFESAVLGAGLAAVFGILALNGLRSRIIRCSMRPTCAHQPRQVLACALNRRTQISLAETKRFLDGFHPDEITEVPY